MSAIVETGVVPPPGAAMVCPQLDMTTRVWSYPAYSRRKRRVVTLQQKINEMIKYQTRGKPLDGDSGELADLAAYVVSLKKK